MYFGNLAVDPGFLLIVAAMVLGLVAQSAVNGTYRRFSAVPTGRGLTGAQTARRILDSYGLANVTVERVQGYLTDHYDPRTGVLRLSDGVYAGSSVASVGIAAHEAGHAVQDAMAYGPFRVRQKLVPVVQLGSQMLIPLILGGIFFRMTELYYIGAAVYGTALLFQIVTLPVEFNASGRAVTYLQQSGSITSGEIAGVRRVLNAAAMTYVAAALASLGQMVWLLMAGRRR